MPAFFAFTVLAGFRSEDSLDSNLTAGVGPAAVDSAFCDAHTVIARNTLRDDIK